jgi:DNA-binding CsgD family transcriptional regulator
VSDDALIAAVEAAYNLEGDMSTWLEGLRKATERVIGPSDLGLWIAAVDVDMHRGARMRGAAGVDDIEAVGRGNGELPPEFLLRCGSYCADLRTHLQKVMGERIVPLADSMPLPAAAHVDVIGIGAVDPAGTILGVSKVVPRGSFTPTPRDEQRWASVTAHWLAGMRLRDAIAAQGAEEDAVLSPTGETLHAEGDAKDKGIREKLREAAAAVDRARGKLRRNDPDEALSLWHGLVEGRWSLVERFESDGRRLMVARRNEPNLRNPRALSSRERQVSTYAVRGYGDKETGYHLGLARSTVASHLASAMRKLGLDSRAALAQLPLCLCDECRGESTT